MLKFNDVSKRYKSKFAVKSININIENAQIKVLQPEEVKI